jgi:hypothetical protein
MIRRSIAVLSLAVAAPLLSPALTAQAGDWTGWITDESCGAKGANRAHEKCARKCHAGGALLVFFHSADGKIYKLDDQAAAEANLGREVRVRGDLQGNTIRVAAIEPAGQY